MEEPFGSRPEKDMLGLANREEEGLRGESEIIFSHCDICWVLIKSVDFEGYFSHNMHEICNFAYHMSFFYMKK